MPMVFAMGGDPVKLGIVASLARPADHGAKGKRFGELPGDWSWRHENGNELALSEQFNALRSLGRLDLIERDAFGAGVALAVVGVEASPI
jgi:hypothetical protein